MNKRGQFDEINPGYILLAVLGGVIAYFVSSYASPGKLVPIFAGVLTPIVVYLYLVMTDR